MNIFNEYLEAEIIPFPKPVADIKIPAPLEDFQEFIKDIYSVIKFYDLKYDEKLNQIWFDEIYNLNK